MLLQYLLSLELTVPHHNLKENSTPVSSTAVQKLSLCWMHRKNHPFHWLILHTFPYCLGIPYILISKETLAFKRLCISNHHFLSKCFLNHIQPSLKMTLKTNWKVQFLKGDRATFSVSSCCKNLRLEERSQHLSK